MNGLLVKHVSESHFDTNVQITQWKNDPYALCFVFFGILENVTQNIFWAIVAMLSCEQGGKSRGRLLEIVKKKTTQ